MVKLSIENMIGATYNNCVFGPCIIIGPLPNKYHIEVKILNRPDFKSNSPGITQLGHASANLDTAQKQIKPESLPSFMTMMKVLLLKG